MTDAVSFVIVTSASLVLAGGLALVAKQVHSLGRTVRKSLKTQQRLEKDLQVAASGAVGMGQRILALEEKVRRLSKTQQELGDASDHYAYSQAMNLFDQGADIETVVSSCGISSSEAQLMSLIRKQAGQKLASPDFASES